MNHRLAVTLAAVTLLGSSAGAQDRSARLSQLLEADGRASERSVQIGLKGAVDEILADGGAIVYAGAPVTVGRAAIRTLLAAQSVLDSLTVQWQPLRAVVSTDGRLGATWGIVVATGPAQGGKGAALGRYIATWQDAGNGWRLLALMQNGIVPRGRTVVPPGAAPAELPALDVTGAAADFIRADLDFSTLAGTADASTAFRRFAAPDAVTMPGLLAIGPDAIGATVAGPPADWKWFPVAAGAAGSGDLGFTVGQAVIQSKDGKNVSYTKYLSVWQRQPDGSVRFLTDGGNGRPKP